MSFVIGRDFAAVQILNKMWNWPYLFNQMEYIDESLQRHWYWQDLAQEIAKYHLPLVGVSPKSKL